MDGSIVDGSWCRAALRAPIDAPRMLVVPVGHARRAEVEGFIADRYRAAYAARVHSFMPLLFALIAADGSILAAAGLRRADSGPLFVEHYLDVPAEELLGARFGQQVERARVAEIGHLSGLGAGGGRLLFPRLACWMQEHGIEWTLFAATSALRELFARMGLRPLPLAPARRERLGAAAEDWGRYYDTDPWVIGGPLLLGRVLLEGAP